MRHPSERQPKVRQARRGALAPIVDSPLEQQVRQRIEKLSYLPTTTAVAMKFIELGKDPDADPAAYTKVVASDASLSTKLLSLANSSYFGVRNKVTKPQVAVNLLGLGTVRTMAITYCLTGLHNDLRLSAQDSRDLWQASLCKAVAARQFAMLLNAGCAEEAFAAALFQDFAMSVLFACAKDEMLKLLDDPSLSVSERLKKERDLFSIDHAEAGETIAQKLDLPQVFVDAIAAHHDSVKLSMAMSDNAALADAVYVAALFPHKLNGWNSSDSETLRAFFVAKAPCKAISFDAFLRTVQTEFEQLYRYFEPGDETEIVLADLLEAVTREAADRAAGLLNSMHGLLQQNASVGQQVVALRERSRQLEHEAIHDRLTAVLNRGGYVNKLNELIHKSRCSPAGYAVAYFDLDDFKILNDQGGHRCGDAALQAVAQAIRELVKPTDLVGRLGGDEFSVAMADRTEADARDTLRKILARIANETFGRSEFTHAPLRSTLSAGMLWIPAGVQADLDTILAQADQLMYEAKRAGGNRVKQGHFTTTGLAA